MSPLVRSASVFLALGLLCVNLAARAPRADDPPQPPTGAAPSPAASPGAQAKLEKKLVWTITADDDFCGLGLISVGVYGTSKRAIDIARWNNLSPPYPLRVGQVLILEDKPIQSVSEGKAALLAFWRSRFKVEEGQNPPSAVRASVAAKGDMALPEESLFDQALAAKTPEQALALYRQNRKQNPDHLPTWFQELKTLARLGRVEEAGVLATILAKRRPELRKLPVIKRYQANAHHR